MHPVLFKLGPLHIKAYGLALALSFVLGIYFACWRGRKQGVDCQQIMDMSIWVLIAAIIGSRLYYVVTHWPEFSAKPLNIINPFQDGELVGIAGLSMQGGVILAVITSLWYLKRKKLAVWKLADICAPSFMLGMALTRIGCFFNGCCFGKPGHAAWCVRFPPESAAGWLFQGVALHPTQLYSSLAGAVLLGAILFLERLKTFEGYTLWLTMALYCAWRFVIDFFRYYETQMTVIKLGSVVIINNQIISLAGIAFSVGLMGYLYRQSRGNKK